MSDIEYDTDSNRPKYNQGTLLPLHRRDVIDAMDALRDVRLFDTGCKRFAWWTALCCILLTVAIILGVSIKQVESTQYGIQYDVHTKYLKDSAYSGGLFIGPPGFEFIKFPSTFISEDLQDTCLSRDGLSVEFKTTFQYQMTEKWLLPAIKRYRNFETWSMIVKSAAKSAIFHSCADYNITDYQKERGELQDRMTDKIRIKLEGHGGEEDVGNHSGVFAKLLSLQVKNLNLPERYSTSVAEKQTAKEDIALAVNQRKQEVTKAKTALLSSKEEARKIADTAKNEANITLTQARLRAEEILYAFENEAETLVRVKEDLNLTVDGILSYLATSVLATASELRVSAQEPASFSHKAL